MMRVAVRCSLALREPFTEVPSRTLLIIGLPASRTNVVPDEAPPNTPLKADGRTSSQPGPPPSRRYLYRLVS